MYDDMCLTLADGSARRFVEVLGILNHYHETHQAVLALYDGTNTGPHDEVSATDVLALNALNAFRSPVMNPMTNLWVDREGIGQRVAAITTRDLETLTDAELEAELPQISNALLTAQGVTQIGPTGAAKLLHRLRPNIIPIYHSTIWKGWYSGLQSDPKWFVWLRRVYSDVRSPRNLACLAALRDRFIVRLPILRLWDIILWQALQDHSRGT